LAQVLQGIKFALAYIVPNFLLAIFVPMVSVNLFSPKVLTTKAGPKFSLKDFRPKRVGMKNAIATIVPSNLSKNFSPKEKIVLWLALHTRD
jgi:hypothetical protein